MPVLADLLIRAPRAVTGLAAEPERPLAVAVTNGTITAVEPLYATTLTSRDTLELSPDEALMPGLVDSHVHACGPGRTEGEGSASGRGLPLLAHAESAPASAPAPPAHATTPDHATPDHASPGYVGHGYAGYLASRPRGLENLAVAQVIEAARATGGHAHIVHLSSSDALPMIASARREGVPITAETCPHYLTLTAAATGDRQTTPQAS